MSLISVQNASFSYGKEQVLKNIQLEIKKGEIFCLFGPNGCGKSTLIQCLLGILKLNSGRVLLREKNIQDLQRHEIAREVAYIPQHHEKPFPFKVIDVVLMGRTSYTGMFSTPAKEDMKIAVEALNHLDILHFKDKPYTQLSGGETQLVLVARALAQKTPILVMDEPTAHLDFRNELSFLETVVRLVKETQITVIMATHFPNHAYYFENNGVDTRIALMNNKIISAQGSCRSILTETNMSSTFHVLTRVISQPWEEGILRHIVPLKTY